MKPRILSRGPAFAAGLAAMICASAISCLPAFASEQTLVLDGSLPGRTFEGVGAVSGGGGTSVLLKDYPEPQRSQILDLLFKPKFAASMQTLYVEVGGDGNSTQGSEPTHMRSRTDLNLRRGYEWWIMEEAKRRNPRLTLDACAWGCPGWVGNGEFWSQDMCDYYAEWIKGLKSVHGLDLDAIGCRNERGPNPAWVVKFRETLDRNGLARVRIHGFDDPGDRRMWGWIPQLEKDPAFASALAVVGNHCLTDAPEPAAVKATIEKFGKPVWDTEEHVYDEGQRRYRDAFDCALGAVHLFNLNAIERGATKIVNWYLAGSTYPIEPYAEQPPALFANSPWSGHYALKPIIWSYAHYGQFTEIGWRYIDGGCAKLAGGGSAVALRSGSGDYSVIVETAGAAAPQRVAFSVRGGLSRLPLCVWKTTRQAQFVRQADLVPGADGAFEMTFEPDALYSLSTTRGQRKGSFPDVPPERPFPFPYRDDFDRYGDGSRFGYLPRYTADICGVFEIAGRPDGRGKCLRQVVRDKAQSWAPEWKPYTVIGDGHWRDYEVGADIAFDDGGWAGVMGRVGRTGDGWDGDPDGYYARLDADGRCALCLASAALGGTRDRKLAEGTVRAWRSGGWHRVVLRFEGPRLTMLVDCSPALEATDATFGSGMAGLITGGDDGARNTACFAHLVINRPGGGPVAPTRFPQNQDPIYADGIRPALGDAPAAVDVAIDADRLVGEVSPRLFGLNATAWDQALATPATVDLLNEIGNKALRFPGGSVGDVYDWSTNASVLHGRRITWATGFDAFARVATQTRAQVYLIANYGTGTPEEAAAWVRYSNVTRNYGFKYWEIGNEVYGAWEADGNTRPHDPVTYAARFARYCAEMKRADPGIKLGAVVALGEDGDANYPDESVVNPRTGERHRGWTPLVLASLRKLNCTPDFVSYHRYDQQPGRESDAGLLMSARTWSDDAGSLRQMLDDYLGEDGRRVELDCTECNSVTANPGKQVVSLVNGLFLADTVGNALQTEFKALVWWDLRNGGTAKYNQSPLLYGWRRVGDYGIVDGARPAGPADRFPTFYVDKLLRHFARGGEQVVKATSDYRGLSAFAVRGTDGGLRVLLVNKHPTAPLTANLSFTGWMPSGTATAYRYGIPQDEAARTGRGSADVQQSAFAAPGSAFTYTAEPYSANVLVIPGAEARATSLDPSVNTAVVPVPRLERDVYDWWARHAAELESGPRIDPEVVLIGDSITHFWAGDPPAARVNGPRAWAATFGTRRVLNLGFGWDRTQNVLWRLDHGEFDGLHPRLVVVNIGTNNFSATPSARANTPEEVAAGILAIRDRILQKSPTSRLLVMGVLPRGHRPDGAFRAPIAALNAILARELAGKPNTTFLDIGKRFLAQDGRLPAELMPDGTHPSEAGYAIWGRALAETGLLP